MNSSRVSQSNLTDNEPVQAAYPAPSDSVNEDFIDVDVVSSSLSDYDEAETDSLILPFSQNSSPIAEIQSTSNLIENNDSQQLHLSQNPVISCTSEISTTISSCPHPSTSFHLENDANEFGLNGPIEEHSLPTSNLSSMSSLAHDQTPGDVGHKALHQLHKHNSAQIKATSLSPLTADDLNISCMDTSLMPASDVASGSSMTCTLVNLLRGLGQQDRYSLEDLCKYLSARMHHCQNKIITSSNTSTIPLVNMVSMQSGHDDMIRSTDLSLGQPSFSNSVNCKTAKKKSASLPARMVGYRKNNSALSGGSLVEYLFACSSIGSNRFNDFSPANQKCGNFCSSSTLHSKQSDHKLSHLSINNDSAFAQRDPLSFRNCSVCLNVEKSTPCNFISSDWRRGRSDGLVCVVAGCDLSLSEATSSHNTFETCNSNKFHSASNFDTKIDCSKAPRKFGLGTLVTGRFINASDWTKFWPSSKKLSNFDQISNEAKLVHWVASYIKAGAVLFLSQLNSSTLSSRAAHSDLQSYDNTFNNDQDIVKDTSSQFQLGFEKAPLELNWRHRLIFGISGQYFLHLSNPMEIVSAASVLKELARSSKLSVSKSDLMRFWHPEKISSVDIQQQQLDTSVHDDDRVFKQLFSSDQDLSMLSRQVDTRWSKLNVLGQVISTLRDYDNLADRLESLNKSRRDMFFRSSFSNGNGSFGDVVEEHQRVSTADEFSSTVPSSHTLESLSPDPYLIIPCAQNPGFSIFILKTNEHLMNSLFTR